MNEKNYRAVQAWFTARPAALRALIWGNKLLSLAVYAAYIVAVAALIFTKDARLWRTILVPAVVFLGGSWLRARLNFPRPYEVYHTAALNGKTLSGQSFPSRHMFSASVLMMCAFWLWAPAGWCMAAVVAILGPLRVLVGVHFIRDVAAGIALGVLCGWIGFFLI